jgi:DNA invertase Pin-like site-specific DNA recombinase
VKPLMYGYMRVDGDESDDGIRHTERQLRALAEAKGYCFAGLFHEYDASQSAFAELIEELKRAEAHHVVVPSLRHLADHHLLRSIMLTQLEREAHALVLELSSQ